MGDTVELSEELSQRIERHLSEDETVEQFIEELLNHYESEGNFLWEGYGGEP